MFDFYNPRKRQKTSGFQSFSGGEKIKNWSEMVTLYKKMKFFIKCFFRKLLIWSHLLKKFLTEKFISCAVLTMNQNHSAVR